MERNHYEFEPSPELGQKMETRLLMEQLHDPADPRLAAVHREVMQGTLDVSEMADIQQIRFEAACEKNLAFMLDADPVDCIRLAFGELPNPSGLGNSHLHILSPWGHYSVRVFKSPSRCNGPEDFSEHPLCCGRR